MNRQLPILLSAFIGIGALASAQVRPGQVTPSPAPPPPSAAPTAVLRGRVVAADTGLGLRRASVTLSSQQSRDQRAATTNLDGRWEFKNLAAGRYSLYATKPPYVRLEYGQRVPSEPGKPIELANGQALDNVEIRLPRGGVIGGRLTDALGEPAAFMRVQAMRVQYIFGRRQLGPTGIMAQTNDLGQYRLAGLPPGSYYVSSLTSVWGGTDDDSGVSYTVSYYPGTTSAEAAQPVVVRLGQDRIGVDFRLFQTRLAKLSGIVLGNQGQPLPNAMLMLMQESRGANIGMATMMSAGRTGSDGRFTVPNIAPGEYSVVSTGTSAGVSLGSERASVPVTVSGEDIEGLTIVMSKGVRATGQIEFESDTPPAVTPAVRLYAFEPAGSRGFSSSGTSTVGEDWSFAIEGVSPGARMFTVSGLPAAFAVKSVLVDGREAVDDPTTFEEGRDVAGVRILMTDRLPGLAGGVTDDRARPLRDYSVVVFSTDTGRWTPSSRYIKTARPDQNGRFTVMNLPPGEYIVAALEYLETGESGDPEFLASLRHRATTVTLAEGERKTLELKLTKRDGQ